MKTILTLPILAIIFFQSGCASNPAQVTTARSKADVIQKMQEIQAQKQQPTVSVNTTERKSIIPDISESSHRGDIARKMLARSSSQFLKADSNRDYQISVEEAKQHFPHVSKDFARYDKNTDGNLSWQELLGHNEWPMPSHKSGSSLAVGK